MGLLCGGQVVSICIDPNDGGATHIMGLMRTSPRIPRDPFVIPTYSQTFWSVKAVLTLSAGYVGSSVVGFLLIVCRSCHSFQSFLNSKWYKFSMCAELKNGLITSERQFAAFDIVASKIASFVIAFGLLVPVLRADHWM